MNLDKYLQPCEFIDANHPNIQKKAKELAANSNQELDIAKACFEFVRDKIRHSYDYQQNPVTLKASDVLAHQTGYCYAKSHLLAALLRANNIPAGLCYQRLTIGLEPPFCLHGLNGIYLSELGWYRVDARGNKQGVNAQFCPPKEQLAFAIKHPEEADLPEIWSKPLPVVVDTLKKYENWQEVARNLPDVALITN